MIQVKIALDKESRILRFDAAGHAGRASPGYDIVCAAFTALARTAFGALEALPGIKVAGVAAEPGSLNFEVTRPAESAERAAGIADFLVRGLGDLEREYPESIRLSIERDLED